MPYSRSPAALAAALPIRTAWALVQVDYSSFVRVQCTVSGYTKGLAWHGYLFASNCSTHGGGAELQVPTLLSSSSLSIWSRFEINYSHGRGELYNQ
jgi:hypothetical protein